MKTQHPLYEILAKEIAYVFDNRKFDNFVDKVLHPEGYILDQSFNKLDTGLRAFGLLPTNAQKTPVLVFGGSSKAINDLKNDNPEGIGFNQFIENRNAIAAWLANIAQATGQKPNVVGHSLGGAISQIVATELMDWVGEVVTFTSPGTSRKIATKFVQNRGAKLSVTHYIIDRNIISLAGEAFIDGTVIIQYFTDCATEPLPNIDKYQTIMLLLSNPPSGFTQTEISVNALNDPAFTFFSPNYLDSLVAHDAISPELASCLTSRGKFEALRQSSFFC